MTYNMREKYKGFIEKEGGIFTPEKRKRLLKYSPGRNGYSQESTQFKYDTRRFVAQALIDLALFIEASDEKDFQRVINVETLKFFVEELFWYPILRKEKPDSNRAQIAELFINYGYNYLRTITPDNLSKPEEDTIKSAMNFSTHLTRSFGPSNRDSFPFGEF